MSKFRNYTFTLNNYTESDENRLKNLIEDKCKFIAYSHEVAPTTGTPHLQGYMCLRSPGSFKAVAKWFPWHIEVMHGSLAQNEIYCSKSSSLIKIGEEPLTPKEGITKRWELAKQGRFDELAPESIKIYEYIYNKFRKVEDRPVLDNIWVYGQSGCGKSSWVVKTFPNHYRKNYSKWWDGYMSEDVVVIDDFSPEHAKFLSDYMKIWTDHYKFNAEVKGGSMTIRPKTFIVTSQYTIEECFPDRKTYMAIDRRFLYRYSYNPCYRSMGWEIGYNRENENELAELLNEF